MSFKKRSSACFLFAGAIIGAIFFFLPSCQGPAGPAGKSGTDTLHIYDTTVKKDTIIHKDTTIVRTYDTTFDTIVKRDTTVKYDTLLMNTSCLGCHATAKWDSITAQYQMSYHFSRGVVNNSNRYCERCHTSEGFQEITGDGLAAAQAAIPMGTRISCKTCHQMKGLDFADTAACILRTVSPVVLHYNNQFVGLTGAWTTQTATDLSGGQGGANNLCGTCHQIRGATSFSFTDTTSILGGDTSAHNSHKFAKADSTAQFTQLPYFPVSKYGPTDSVSYKTGTSYAVHDGNQTNLHLGINAYEYTGITYAGKDSSSWIHIKMDCADCHVFTKFSAADSTGGHTYRINRNDPKCANCHNALPSGSLTALIKTDSSTIRGLLVTLGDLLVTRKVFTKTASTTNPLGASYAAQATHDFYGTLYSPAAADSAKYYASIAGANSVSPTTGILNYNNMVTWTKDKTYAGRIGRQWTSGEFGAAYNFQFVYTGQYQHSYGIHNPAYVKAVLQASIDWLNAH